jgi:3-hydroxyisobutyrate dehydrogenase-like beta-hydroxyacid dehydrogenase
LRRRSRARNADSLRTTPGANGAGIGADLVDAGLDVTFIDQWTAKVEAIRAHGGDPLSAAAA